MKRIQEVSVLLQRLISSASNTESAEVIRIFDLKISKDSIVLINNISRELRSLPEFSMQLTLDVGEELSVEDGLEYYVDKELNIKITKPISSVVYFFSEKGINEYLEQPGALQGIDFVFISFLTTSFESHSVIFSNQISESVKKKENNEIILIKYVKPLNSVAQSYMAADLSKWVTKSSLDQGSLKSWIHVSTRKLLFSISIEFVIFDKEVILQIIGDRRKKLIFYLDSQFSEPFNALLNSICYWIYLEGKDVDTRHNIFNNELSKIISEEYKLTEIDKAFELFILALENSKLVYRYHLVSSSKELNKTLIDLNKSLFEYVSKIRQNTIDLINTLWRDFATAFGILVLNYSLKKPEVSSNYFKYFGIALIIYLVVSFTLSSNVSLWFYASLKKNLTDWRSKIYGYISDEEFEKFSINPLKRAQGKYLFTFWTTLILYLIMIVVILQFLLGVTIIPILGTNSDLPSGISLHK